MPPSRPLGDLLRRYLDLRARGESVSIENLCRDAPELLADLRREIAAVESMEAMESDLRITMRPEAAGTCSAGSLLSPGTVAAGYELLEELGRGGMGVVFKARQVSLKRLVALKMVRAGGFQSPESRERFLAEAAVVARLHHPNVLQILECRTHDDQLYFSMEL